MKTRTTLRRVVQVHEAVERAQAHLRNAMELAQRPIGKEELLYMWDNQITAVDNFLADTEELGDKLLERARDQLRGVKKKLTDAVVAFEAQAAGEEAPDEDDVPDEEWAAAYVDMAGDMVAVVSEALEDKVKDLSEMLKLEEPLAVVNGYLADSEPFQAASAELKKVRALVRAARNDLRNRIRDLEVKWRSDEPDDED